MEVNIIDPPPYHVFSMTVKYNYRVVITFAQKFTVSSYLYLKGGKFTAGSEATARPIKTVISCKVGSSLSRLKPWALILSLRR